MSDPTFQNASAAQNCQQTNVPATIKLRPVIFVHGFISDPSSWAKTFQTLASPPYSADNKYQFFTFDYSSNSTSWPSVPQISECLARFLVFVSRAYSTTGGDGKVLTVGHSMGGIAIRFASVLSYDGTAVSSILGGVVTLDTPHLGSPFGGTWLAAAAQESIHATSSVAFPPPGSSAEICLAEPTRRPKSCQAPPYLPAGVPLTEIGTQITVQRKLANIGLATFTLFGDGIVPLNSSQGYIGSGPLKADGTISLPPKTQISVLTVKCAFSSNLLGLGVYGVFVDRNATNAMLVGSGASSLIAITKEAMKSPCFHTNLTSYDPVLQDMMNSLAKYKKQLDAFKQTPTTTPTTPMTQSGSGGESAAIPTCINAISVSTAHTSSPELILRGAVSGDGKTILIGQGRLEAGPVKLSISHDAGCNWTQQSVESRISGLWVSKDGRRMFVDTAFYQLASDDAGATWRTISRSFSKVIFSDDGTMIYGISDGMLWQIFTEGDKVVQIENSPSGLVDISMSKGTELIVLSSRTGLYRSTNSGLTWELISPIELNGIPNHSHLNFAVSSNGKDIYLNTLVGTATGLDFSKDGGRTWNGVYDTANGELKYPQSEATSSDGNILVVAASSGIHTSLNGGKNWILRTPNGLVHWYKVSCSSDCTRILANSTDDLEGIYSSTDFGNTWKRL